MNFRTRCVVLLGVLLLPATVFGAAPGMKEGLWEITTTMEMPGMPFQPPPTTMTHCYTKADLKDKKGIVPKQEGDCKITDLKQSASRVTWKVVCSGENKGTGEGEIVFKGATAYEGTMKLDMQGMKATTRYKAKRIGDCQ